MASHNAAFLFSCFCLFGCFAQTDSAVRWITPISPLVQSQSGLGLGVAVLPIPGAGFQVGRHAISPYRYPLSMVSSIKATTVPAFKDRSQQSKGLSFPNHKLTVARAYPVPVRATSFPHHSIYSSVNPLPSALQRHQQTLPQYSRPSRDPTHTRSWWPPHRVPFSVKERKHSPPLGFPEDIQAKQMEFDTAQIRRKPWKFPGRGPGAPLTLGNVKQDHRSHHLGGNPHPMVLVAPPRANQPLFPGQTGRLRQVFLRMGR